MSPVQYNRTAVCGSSDFHMYGGWADNLSGSFPKVLLPPFSIFCPASQTAWSNELNLDPRGGRASLALTLFTQKVITTLMKEEDLQTKFEL